MHKKIVIYDAIPAMADVISGAVKRPIPFHATKKTNWWQWAIASLAGQKALQILGIPCNYAEPWKESFVDKNHYWRFQTWIDPSKIADAIDNQFEGAVDDIRTALGEKLAGVFYCELVDQTPLTRNSYSRKTFIAINIDGTRAATLEILDA
jgi:hypothetical protein